MKNINLCFKCNSNLNYIHDYSTYDCHNCSISFLYENMNSMNIDYLYYIILSYNKYMINSINDVYCKRIFIEICHRGSNNERLSSMIDLDGSIYDQINLTPEDLYNISMNVLENIIFI